MAFVQNVVQNKGKQCPDKPHARLLLSTITVRFLSKVCLLICLVEKKLHFSCIYDAMNYFCSRPLCRDLSITLETPSVLFIFFHAPHVDALSSAPPHLLKYYCCMPLLCCVSSVRLPRQSCCLSAVGGDRVLLGSERCWCSWDVRARWLFRHRQARSR